VPRVFGGFQGFSGINFSPPNYSVTNSLTYLFTNSLTMQTEPQTLDFSLQTSALKKRRPGPPSKIAQLPTELRSLVNQLLDQAKTYEEVVGELAKHGVSLTIDNVFKWFNGPYQDYLIALEWRDELQQLRDHAFSFGQEEANVRFQEGVVQIG